MLKERLQHQMFLSLFVSSCLMFLANAVQYTPVIETEGGRIRGRLANLTTGHVVRKYLGIPFAIADRFKPPANATRWSDVKDMVTFGKECPQIPSTFSGKDVSEACLNLNVFVPDAPSSGTPLPVMVWVHGGAYITGSNRLYDGSYISCLGNVVVVVINYRLGVFGFLTTGDSGNLKGNYGMLDQVQALEWVKRNIARFDGDPNKVTIFGVSAGGSSVSLLMLSPLSKGLFKNVIMQSGAATAKWAVAYYHEAKKGAEAFGKHVGCTDMKTIIECLESKSLNQIIKASSMVTNILFSPVIDGKFLPDAPSVLLEGGQLEKVNVMVGVTDDEGSVAINALSGSSTGMNVTYGIQRNVFTAAIKSDKFQLVRNPKPPLPSAMIYRYTDWTNVSDPYRNRRMFMDMMGDSMFVAPAIQSAKAFINHTLPTYFYQLRYRADYDFFGNLLPSWIKAYHAADVPFVFGLYLSLSAKHLTSKNANFSRDIITMWSNFAKSGDPNNPESIQTSWPQYDLNKQQYIALKPDMVIETKLRAEYVAFWNDFVPEFLRSMSTEKPCGVPSKAKKMITDILVVSSVVLAALFVIEI